MTESKITSEENNNTNKAVEYTAEQNAEMATAFFEASDAAKKAIAPADPIEDSEEEDEDEDLDSIDSDFRLLYAGAQSLEKRWSAMYSKMENGPEKTILRLLIGDMIPLMIDSIATSGSGFAEIEAVVASQSSGGEDSEGLNITEEELTQIYMTLFSNSQLFKRLKSKSVNSDANASLDNVIDLNEQTMGMISESFGPEVRASALAYITEAQAEIKA